MSKPSSREISILNQEIEQPEPEMKEEEKPTKRESTKPSELFDNFMKKLEPTGLDLYMLMEFFVFFLSFWFWVGEEDKVRNVDSMYLYMLNSFLVLDFFFRMLSLKIDSVKREYWNHTLHCVLPLIMWLLAAYYKFDNVFGSNPIKVLNALLFTLMNLFVVLLLVFKFVSMDKLQNCLKKKETTVKPEPEPESEQNDVELGTE